MEHRGPYHRIVGTKDRTILDEVSSQRVPERRIERGDDRAAMPFSSYLKSAFVVM
jgi:hypothetical protein